MYFCSMYSKELLKGIFPAILLKLLADNGKMYGYQIAQKVKELSNNKISLKEGSMYPALHKLKEEGFIDVETEYIGKRVRHYYTLSPEGYQEMEKKKSELKDFVNTINIIMSF